MNRIFVLVAAVLGLIAGSAQAGVAPVELKELSAINSGDTAWMLTSAALVLMMTGPALALFYGGLVRRKNVLGTMMQSFILMAVVSVLWAIVGYSLAFDTGNVLFGGLRFAFLREVGSQPAEYAATIPHTTFMVYQLMFAVITPALICGAYAERMKFSAMLIFSSLWLLVIYCPMAHMVWGKGGLLNAFAGDPSMNIPALDFAGGTVVHISSGVSALICALVLGKRAGFGRTPMPPHSVVLSVIGAAMLWVGWFGFNGGSALGANALASNAFTATHFAAAAGALGWMFAEWLRTGKPTVLGAISGAVAGLVIITPASGFTTPMWGIVTGLIGGVICMIASTTLKSRLGYDDSLDAFGVHGVGGTVGAILTGVFAVGAINGKAGLIDGNGIQVWHQFLATLLTWGFAAAGSFILLKLTGALVGLRISTEQENVGLDLTQHGEAGYILDESSTASVSSIDHGISPAEARPEPRSADVPRNGKKHFAVIVDGVPVNELTEAWSELCQPSTDGGPSPEFKAVYPYVTTVSGTKFRFRGGEPNIMKENLVKMFEHELQGRKLTGQLEAA